MLPDRIESKIERVTESGCWIWMAFCLRDGYGQIRHGEKVCRAHRVVYEMLVGPILDGMQLDHLCRVRCCVNPAHLEPVSTQENTKRGNGPAMKNLRKTHCLRGHPLVEENIYVRPTRPTERICRACRSGGHR